MGLSLRKLGSKIWDEVNPLDNGRTFSNQTPQNNQSVRQQLGNAARPVAQAYQNAARVVAPVVDAAQPFDELAQTAGKVIAPVVNAVPEVPDTSPLRFANNAVIRPFKTTESHAADILQGNNPYRGSLEQQAGQLGQDVINAASVLPVGRGAEIALKGAPVAAKIAQGAKFGVKTGAGFGAAQGAATSLQDELGLKASAKTIGINTVAGAGLGGALGAGAPALAGAGKVALKRAGEIKLPQPTPLGQEGFAKVPGYRSTHQITDSVPAHQANIDEIVGQVKGKYGLTNFDQKDIQNLRKLASNPNADVKIYRASPKNEINGGDWVTTSKTYAQDIKRQNGGKVYEHTVKAKDLHLPQNIEDNPSLARFSAFQYNPTKNKLGLKKLDQEGKLNLGALFGRNQDFHYSSSDGITTTSGKRNLVIKKLNETGAVGKDVSKPSIPVEPTNALKQEALKYKSAEEFVKAQESQKTQLKSPFYKQEKLTLYRGSNKFNKSQASPDRAVFHADNQEYASTYGKVSSKQASGGVLDGGNIHGMDSINTELRQAVQRNLDKTWNELTGVEQTELQSWVNHTLHGESLSRQLSKPMPEPVKKAFDELGIDYIRIPGDSFPGTVGKVGHQTEVIELPKPRAKQQLTDLYNQATQKTNKLGLKKLNEGGYAKIPKASQLPKVALKQETAPQAPVPENNLVDSLPNNNIADNTKVPLQVTNKDTLLGELKTAMVDKDAPILDYLKGVEKETGQTGLVKQFMYDTGLQRRSSSIANAMMDNSDNLSAAFRGLVGKEKKAFDGYVGARREIQYAKDGLQTSAPVEELQGVVSAGSRFDDRYNALNGYYKEWAGRLHQAGILDDATYKSFTDSGEYTRVQRVMDDLAGFRGSGGNSYSLGTTMTKQKRKGSQRDIQPADLTAMKYAQDSQTEIQRNQTSSNLIDVLASQGHARQVENTTSKNTLSRIVDGKTEIWEVPRDIKEIADNVTPFQLGALGRIVSAPQRLLRAGATGLSAPFTAANYVKDQVSSGVFSKSVMDTHRPDNIVNGIYLAAKDFGVGVDDPLWQKFQQHLGDTTSYDFIRNQSSNKDLSREMRLGQSGRAINKTIHPIRTLEDLNQVTEKATRFQNFKGIYEKTLKETGSEADATRAATIAAWQNSVDFSRMGDVSQALNLLIPYFNAGIQGTRTLGRAFAQRPVATTAKTVGGVAMPLAGITLYNLSDPQRRAVYDNISDYEKENNIVVVLPGAKQLKDGSYEGVIKVPLQPGLSNLVQPVRTSIENYAHSEPQDVAKMAKEFVGALTGPINTSNMAAFGGSFLPQGVKPIVQQYANKDLFTGKPIVPEYIEKATDAQGNPIPEQKKAFEDTSATSRGISKVTGVSPIRVDKFIKDTSGKVGQYSQNAVDNALAKAGVTPKNEVGGVSIGSDFTRRFARASGKENFQKSEGAKYFDNVKEVTDKLNGNEKAGFASLHPNKKNFLGDTITDMDSVYNSAARLDIYNRYPKVFEADKKLDAKGRANGNPGNPLFDLQPWQVKKVLEKENLPPGASDKELSNLKSQDWYNDYSAKKSQFFTAIKDKSAQDLEVAKAKGDTKTVESLQKSIDKFSSSDNPYPVTPPDLQKAMNGYSALPKGTGARKAWIQSNPGLYAQMQDQYAKIDNWQNIQRGKRGLDTTEGDAGKVAGYDSGSSGGKSYGGGGGGGSKNSVESAYKYAISAKAGGKIAKPRVTAKVGKPKIAKKGNSKIKVSSKKSLV